MITMQKLNVVKVVATEDAAQKLESLGYTRAVVADSRKPYTAPWIETVGAAGAVTEGITPDGTAGEKAPEGATSNFAPDIPVEEVEQESPSSDVSPEGKAPNGAPDDITPVNPAEEVKQNDTGADKPHRGNGKK